MKITDEHKDLFSIENLDEMQKLQAYKLTYKCFKGLFWVTLAFSVILLFPGLSDNSITFSIIGLTMEICTFIFYIIFAAKSAKFGIMNPLFAKMAAKTSYIVSYVFILITWVIIYLDNWFETKNMFYLILCLYVAVAYISTLICCIFARVNNKNIEKVDEE